MDFKNSETAKNLMRAFAGESQARNRYTFAAGIARKEVLFVIESVFSFTADQEKEHGEIFYNYLKELGGETIFIDGGYPVDQYEKSLDYLQRITMNTRNLKMSTRILQKRQRKRDLARLQPVFL